MEADEEDSKEILVEEDEEMEVETQGVDPITRMLEYIPLCKGKAKVSKDIDESKSSLETSLLLDDIVFEGAHLRRVSMLKFEDWDLVEHEKLPHSAMAKLMHQNINVSARMIELEPRKWLRGVEKVGLINLLWVPHYHRALVTIFFIKQLL